MVNTTRRQRIIRIKSIVRQYKHRDSDIDCIIRAKLIKDLRVCESLDDIESAISRFEWLMWRAMDQLTRN